MSVFSQRATADAGWMIDEVGEEIVYTPQGKNSVPHTFTALIDRNAEKQPAYGHVGGLSTKHHEFTFMKANLPGITPQKGDFIDIVGEQNQYRVEHIYPDDEDAWTVIAR